MLTTGEISGMRATLELTLPGSAVFQSRAHSADGQGGFSRSYSATGTVACRLSPRSGGEETHGDRLTTVTEWVLTVPASTSVETKGRVVVDGATYEIETCRAPRSWEISRRLEVSAVD